MKNLLLAALLSAMACLNVASAQTPDNPEIAACKATGILALKEKSPAIRDIILDMDTMVVSKADTEIGKASLSAPSSWGMSIWRKKEMGKARHFLCLIGDKGKVLLTFFETP